MTDTRVVLVTAPDEGAARTLAHALLEERLVACANVIPGVTSVYRWKGKVHQDPESLMVLKAPGSCVERLLRRVPELHPYDVPEVLVLEVGAGYEPYLNWVADECGSPEAP
jgi:periplasmic divalent cation tolerance protein